MGSNQQQYTGVVRYIAGKKRAEEALGFVSACASALEQSTDLADGLQATVDRCVPLLGTSCLIEVSGSAAAPLARATAGADGPLPSVETATVAATRAPSDDEVTALACGLDYAGQRYGRLVVARLSTNGEGAPVFDDFDRALVSEVARATALWLAANGTRWGAIPTALPEA